MNKMSDNHILTLMHIRHQSITHTSSFQYCGVSSASKLSVRKKCSSIVDHVSTVHLDSSGRTRQ